MEPVNLELRIWYRGLTADQREFFDERAGILEFEGNLPREEAERQATLLTATNFGLPQPVLPWH